MWCWYTAGLCLPFYSLRFREWSWEGVLIQINEARLRAAQASPVFLLCVCEDGAKLCSLETVFPHDGARSAAKNYLGNYLCSKRYDVNCLYILRYPFMRRCFNCFSSYKQFFFLIGCACLQTYQARSAFSVHFIQKCVYMHKKNDVDDPLFFLGSVIEKLVN